MTSHFIVTRYYIVFVLSERFYYLFQIFIVYLYLLHYLLNFISILNVPSTFLSQVKSMYISTICDRDAVTGLHTPQTSDVCCLSGFFLHNRELNLKTCLVSWYLRLKTSEKERAKSVLSRFHQKWENKRQYE